MTSEPRSRSVLFVLLLLCAGVVSGCWRRHFERSERPTEIEAPSQRRPLEHIDIDAVKIRAALDGSVHAKIDCSGCHGAEQKREHPNDVGKGQCTSCHEKEAAAYAETVHATAVQKGEDAAKCVDCHGMHEVKAVKDPTSSVSPRNVPGTCGNCHENPALAKKLGISKPLAVRQYVESIHGKALLLQGLVVAPSCADCHGKAHRIFKASDPRSTVNRFNVAATCGTCHAGEREKYSNSVHAKALGEEASAGGVRETKSLNVSKDKKPPTCPDCHSAHQIVAKGPAFLLASDKICGECHQDRLRGYLDTYHGRALDLRDADVAACFNCHGAHDIWPSSNPISRVSDQNRQGTCQTCHASASKNFSQYLTHADHSDRKHYPMLYWAFVTMTALLVGTFGFFGVHTLLWLVRTLVLKFRDPEGFREAKQSARTEEGAKLYPRFRPVDRVVHLLVIVSFILLVVTGMPLKFHTTGWAHAFFNAIGGAVIASSVHRFAAIVTLGYFTLHILSLRALLRERWLQFHDDKGRLQLGKFLRLAFGPDSPLPRWQDVKDLVAHTRWFFGRGSRPKFDRFTYWEKFDYIAVFWGVTVIGLSGLVMWFPEVFTIFLPGWSINVAQIIHSDEALLAAGFIFVFHFFNSHFRPEKFPFDAVMFSGHVTEAELRHERPALYERMAKSGELEKYQTLGEWSSWKPMATTFGVTAIIVGLSLAALIFWALLR